MSIIQRCGALEPGEKAGAFFDDGSGRLCLLQVLEFLATACRALSSFPSPETVVVSSLALCVQEVAGIFKHLPVFSLAWCM